MQKKKKCNLRDIESGSLNARKSLRLLIDKAKINVKKDKSSNQKNSLSSSSSSSLSSSNVNKSRNYDLKAICSKRNSKHIVVDNGFVKKLKVDRSKRKRLQEQNQQQKRNQQSRQHSKENIKNPKFSKSIYYIRGTLPKLKSVTLQEAKNLTRKFVYYESPIIKLIKRNKLFLAVQNGSLDFETESVRNLMSLNTVPDNHLIKNSLPKYLYETINMNRRLQNSTVTKKNLIKENSNMNEKVINCEISSIKKEEQTLKEGINNKFGKRRTIKKSFSPNNPCVLVQRSPNFLKNLKKEKLTEMETLASDNSINSRSSESLTDVSNISFLSSDLQDTISLLSESSKENDCTVSIVEKKKNLKVKKEKNCNSENKIKNDSIRSNGHKKINATEVPISPKQFNLLLKEDFELINNNNNNMELIPDCFEIENRTERNKELAKIENNSKLLKEECKNDKNLTKSPTNINKKKKSSISKSISKKRKKTVAEKSSLQTVKSKANNKKRDKIVNKIELDVNNTKTSNVKTNSKIGKELDIYKSNKRMNKNSNIDNSTIYKNIGKSVHKFSNKTNVESAKIMKKSVENKSSINIDLNGSVGNKENELNTEENIEKIENENQENKSVEISISKNLKIKKEIRGKKVNKSTNAIKKSSNQNLKKSNLKMTDNCKNVIIKKNVKNDKTENAINSFQDDDESVIAKENLKTENSQSTEIFEEKLITKKNLNFAMNEIFSSKKNAKILEYHNNNLNFNKEEDNSIAYEIVEQLIEKSVDLLNNEEHHINKSENLMNDACKRSSKRLAAFSPSHRESKYIKLERSSEIWSLNCSSSSTIVEGSNSLERLNEENENFNSLRKINTTETVKSYTSTKPLKQTIPGEDNKNENHQNKSQLKLNQTYTTSDLCKRDVELKVAGVSVNQSQVMGYSSIQQSCYKNEKPDLKQLNDIENNFFRMQNSPSTNSMVDIAKGSSIDVEMDFPVSVGDIFWSRMSSYPYWPCIVWPDHENRTVSVRFINHTQKNQLRIHVRFFADNGRRSWVPKNNMIPYKGREDFERLCEENSKRFSKKYCVSKGFIIPKKPLWEKAIEEADQIQLHPIEIRCLEFEKMVENIRSILFRKRRKERDSTESRLSDNLKIDICFDEHNNSKELIKRDRSPTPESPPYESIDDLRMFVKRSKVEDITFENNNSSTVITDMNLFNTENRTESNEFEVKHENKLEEDLMKNLSSFNSKSYEDQKTFDEKEFKNFYQFLKPYILCGSESNNNLLENDFSMYVKELWLLRNISRNTVNNFDTSKSIFDSNCKSSRLLSNQMKKLSEQLLGSPSSSKNLNSSLNIKNNSTKNVKKKSTGLKSRPIDEVVDDILVLQKNYLFRGLIRKPICKVCRKPSKLIKCSGSCCSWLHYSCRDKKSTSNQKENKSTGKQKRKINIIGDIENELQSFESMDVMTKTESADHIETESMKNEKIYCLECKSGTEPMCIVCKKNSLNSEESPIRCSVSNCGEYFHIKCLKYWPQAKLKKSSTSKIESLLCPRHTCHTCVCDDPRGKFLQISKANVAKCVECPATYHLDSFCIPAGTQFITATHIICPRHYEKGQDKIVNANWCFICATGGSLICCETCPTAFHLECLKMSQPDESYICEECETGRLPLYGELVWVKLSSFRWWPAIIIPPPEVPVNIKRIKHKPNEFCVRFFGSDDHAWVYRSKVFIYQEGDWGFTTNKNGIDNVYQKGLAEARRIFNVLKTKRLQLKTTDDKEKQIAPLPYVKIKTSRPVPPLKLQELDISELTTCDCSEFDENPCGPNSNCLNRILFTECNPKICPAGKKCQNQMFESRLYPNLEISITEGKGWGLKCLEPIKAGTFVIEYVGEIIDDAEFKRRIAQKQEERDENYYFLTLENNHIIDAGPKGNLARFMNHSCEPNCETQKWNVNGITRIGLFAIKDIPANTELTFNYNLQCIGNDKKICNCGTEKCTGYIGVKYKERIMAEELETKKTKKQKKINKKIAEK